MLFVNLLLKEFEILRLEMEEVIRIVVKEVEEKVLGNENILFVLRRIRELIDGRSVIVNKVLVRDNVVRVVKIVVEFFKLVDGNLVMVGMVLVSNVIVM